MDERGIHAPLNVNQIFRTWDGPTRRAMDVNHLVARDSHAWRARGDGFLSVG